MVGGMEVEGFSGWLGGIEVGGVSFLGGRMEVEVFSV